MGMPWAPDVADGPAALHARWRRAQGLLHRAREHLGWQGLAAVAAFAALYGMTQGMRGIAPALMLFVPAYALTALVAPFAPRRMLPRTLVLALAIGLGVVIDYAIVALAQHDVVAWRGGGVRHAMALLPVLLTMWLGLAMFLLHERERATAQAVHDEVERKLDIERQMSEARLRVLESQIEPHFLFNSLAHVRRLCRTRTPEGRTMLRHLSHYLGEALPALRHGDIPLAADADLALSYLNVQQIRMGERLRFSVDIAPEACAARLPPMTLTTLVENAIKHGLSPLESGGEIRICARADHQAVVVEVSDTGRGFQSTIGSGLGLANTRARLHVLHGTAASLALSTNTPQGVVATITLPRGHACAASA